MRLVFGERRRSIGRQQLKGREAPQRAASSTRGSASATKASGQNASEYRRRAKVDSRAKALVLQYSGVPSVGGIGGMGSFKKEDLSRFHTPVLYINGGPDDVSQPNALEDFKAFKRVRLCNTAHTS